MQSRRKSGSMIFSLLGALFTLFIIAALVLVFLVTSIAELGIPGQPAEQVEVVIRGGEYYLDPSEVRVKAGVRVVLTFENEGNILHALVIENESLGVKIEVPLVSPGTSATVEFTIDTPGRYDLYCPVGFHRQLGMEGVFIVEP